MLLLLPNLDMGGGAPPVVPANSVLHKGVPTAKWENTWRKPFDWQVVSGTPTGS